MDGALSDECTVSITPVVKSKGARRLVALWSMMLHVILKESGCYKESGGVMYGIQLVPYQITFLSRYNDLVCRYNNIGFLF